MGDETFGPRDDGDIQRLVTEHPLAWVTSGQGDDQTATLLPVRVMFAANGKPVELVGHFSRANPQLAGLRDDPRALVLFLGPHGYVSPSWMADRSQAPTWNYVSTQFRVEISLTTDPAQIRAHLEDLVAFMERGRPRGWRVEELGERYAGLSQGIVGFRARIVETRGKFKLGQDERDDVFNDITGGLTQNGCHALRNWMTDFSHQSGRGARPRSS